MQFEGDSRSSSKAKYLFIIPTFVLLSLFTVFALIPAIAPPASSGGLDYHGYVCKQVIRGEGSMFGPPGPEPTFCDDNMVVDAGLEHIADVLGQGTAGATAAFDYIGLCNASAACSNPAEADTTLENEYTISGLGRAQGTYGDLGNGNWSIFNTFTSSGDDATLEINKTALFNQSSGGTMLAANTFNLVTLDGTAGDQLTVNWTIFVINSTG